MEATVLYGARDVRFEDRPDPTIVEPTDAIIRLPFTCICGSDLWPYRGIQAVSSPAPMGHEYCGVRRGGRPRRHVDQARPVRDRVVLRLRQHVPALPPRLSDVVPALRTRCRRAGAAHARAARGRHARRDSRRPGRRHDPEPARRSPT